MEEKIEALIEIDELKKELKNMTESMRYYSDKYNEVLNERNMIVFAIRKIVSVNNNNKSI